MSASRRSRHGWPSYGPRRRRFSVHVASSPTTPTRYPPANRFWPLASGTWTPVDQRLYTQPLNSKHGSIQPITTTEYDNLLAKWGAPAWNRLKSYNYPARYVRHSNYTGRIDEYPFDPYADAQWTLVPGLADAAGVSFRSVNYPTRYLRHSNYQMALAVNDGHLRVRSEPSRRLFIQAVVELNGGDLIRVRCEECGRVATVRTGFHEHPMPAAAKDA